MASFLDSIGYNGWVLPALLIIPLVGAVALMLIPARDSTTEGGVETPAARQVAFWFFLLEFVVSLGLWWSFNPADTGWQAAIDLPWIPSWGARFTLGVDGIALMMVLLTTFIMPLSVLGSFTGVRTKVRSYYALLLVLTTGMLGVFMARDLFLFYVMWDVMLVPMYFIIGIWGGERRIYASIKFFIYTFLPSLLMLVAIIYLGLHTRTAAGTPDFSYDHILAVNSVSAKTAKYLFAAFFLAFAVKVPMFPFHTWLPDAHVEAPTAGSVILAGVLLKMGTYGVIRFSLPFFPNVLSNPATFMHMTMRGWMIFLSIVGILYGALVSLMQKDMKKLVAYSSVSHLGFCTLGIFVLTPLGLSGSVLQQINHGISTGALFLIVGILYERRHTREIAEYGGISNVMPVYATITMIMFLSSMGLPLLNGFVGEFTILQGTFMEKWRWGAWAVPGVVLAAAYLLWLYQRVFFGTVTNPKNEKLHDLTPREVATFVPLIIMAFWIGLYPKPFFQILEQPVNHTIAIVRPDYPQPGATVNASVQTPAPDTRMGPTTPQTKGKKP